jgi:hypothetical protein
MDVIKRKIYRTYLGKEIEQVQENNEVDIAMVSVLPKKLKANQVELMKKKALYSLGSKQLPTTKLKTSGNFWT